jgi:DNA primase
MDSSKLSRIKEEIRDALDIVSFIDRYVQLRRTGHNYKGLCPFHNEKSPSFVVSPDKDMYHCFGCGTGGDIFSFIMDMEGCTFMEAMELAGNETGIDVRALMKNSRGYTPKRDSAIPKNLLFRINTYASRYFYGQVKNQPRAIDFFRKRGLSAETVKIFMLGYAPDAWAGLTTQASRDGYLPTVVKAAGLALSPAENDSTVYDRFRNRIIFPIFDISGRVIAFGGRTMEKEGIPKYLNSPETAVYHKNRTLYGLHLSRPVIRERSAVIVVEGYMDMIALYQRGIQNVVATCGTALTPEQGRIMKRFASQIFLVFDGDSAGLQAAKRAVENLISLEVYIKIVVLSADEDPDSFVSQHGKSGFDALLDTAAEAVEFYIKLLKDALDTTTPQGRAEAVDKVIDLVSRIENPLIKSEYIRVISREFAVEERLLTPIINGKKTPQRADRNPGDTVDETRNFAAFISTEEGSLLHFLILHPAYAETYSYRLREDLFIDPTHKEVYSCILKYAEQLHKQVSEIENAYLRKLICFLLIREIEIDSSAEEWLEHKISRLENSRITRTKNRLVEEISKTRDSERKKQLLYELNRLTQKKRKNSASEKHV